MPANPNLSERLMFISDALERVLDTPSPWEARLPVFRAIQLALLDCERAAIEMESGSASVLPRHSHLEGGGDAN